MAIVESKFPWADQPLAIRTLLTGLTLPIAAPMLMALILAFMLVAAAVTVVIPFAYVIAGLSPGKPAGKENDNA